MSALPQMLRYSRDAEAGITRRQSQNAFEYFDTNNNRISNEKTLLRINNLGLPPAYEDVWICKDEFGHLQATGRDAAGRKQYRYHEEWRRYQDLKKFETLVEFGGALPKLRRKIRRDLRRQNNSKSFVCAALTRLIDTGALRIGHERNEAVGASTLQRRHVKIKGDALRLDYRAKGGKRVRKVLRDKTLARALHQVDDLPGYSIFQFINETGDLCSIDSSHVNDYIGPNFTAKTFRTWHGSTAAFEAAQKNDGILTIKTMSEAAAERLHNTPSICRSSYIHPKIIALAETNSPVDCEAVDLRGLRKSEKAMLAFLQT